MALKDLLFPKYPAIDHGDERKVVDNMLDSDEMSLALVEALAPYRAIDDEYREKLEADLLHLSKTETALVEELVYRETRLREARRSKVAIMAALDALAPEKKVADGYAGAA